MPITFNCPCGKALRVADEHAGRRVKCPACQAVATVPTAEPQFEVVEEAAPPPPPVPKVKPAAQVFVDEDDDDARGYTVAKKKGRDDEEDEPRAKKKPDFRKGSGRRAADTEDDDDDDRPKKKSGAQKNTGGSLEGKVFNGGVGVGILAMVGAVVWFVVGIVALDVIFFYPPILFIIGLVAFFKGLMGRE